MTVDHRGRTLRLPPDRRRDPAERLASPPPLDDVDMAEPAPYDAEQEQPGSGGYDQLLAWTQAGPDRDAPEVIRPARLQSQRKGWSGPAVTTHGRTRSTRAS